MGSLDEDITQLQQQAREALGREWSAARWDYWVRVSWRNRVSATTANEHLERLLSDLHRTASPMIRMVAGFHGDDPENPHAHVLVHLSRRVRQRFETEDGFRDWFAGYWYHGQCWAMAFDPTRRDAGTGGGAIAYLARHPDTVVWG